MSAIVVFDKKHLRIAVAAERRQGRLRRLKRNPRILAPKRFEAAYFVHIKAFLRTLEDLIRSRLIARLPDIMRSANHELRRDSFDDEIEAAIQSIKIELARVVPANEARRIAAKTAQQQLLDQQRVFEQVLGVRPELHETWLEPLLDSFTRTNTRLITGVGEAMLDKIDRLVGEGVRSGISIDTLTGQIQALADPEEGGFAYERARLIASDQVTKFYGDVAQVRQQQLGVERYAWQTAEDIRVRDSHKERNKLIFTWDDIVPQLEAYGLEVPDYANHPGKEIRCRCIALPLLDDLLDAPAPEEET